MRSTLLSSSFPTINLFSFVVSPLILQYLISASVKSPQHNTRTAFVKLFEFLASIAIASGICCKIKIKDYE